MLRTLLKILSLIPKFKDATLKTQHFLMKFFRMTQKLIKYFNLRQKHYMNKCILFKVYNEEMKIKLCDFKFKYHIYPLLLLFAWKNYVEIYTSFCYRIIRPDELEIFPAEVTMDHNIGSGAFGTVFCGHISRHVCKKLPYFKLHSKKLGRKGEMNRVAVKRLKGGCSIFSFIYSFIVF